MIPMKTITPAQMAYVHELVVGGCDLKAACRRLGYKRGKRLHPQTLRRHYWYAMQHGLAAWYD